MRNFFAVLAAVALVLLGMRAALADRPDLKAQRAAVLASRASERSAKGRFAPRLFLDSDVGFECDAFSARLTRYNDCLLGGGEIVVDSQHLGAFLGEP